MTKAPQIRLCAGILYIIIDVPIIIAPHVIIATDDTPMFTSNGGPIIELIAGKNARCQTGKIIPEIRIMIPAASDNPKYTDTFDFSFVTDTSQSSL